MLSATEEMNVRRCVVTSGLPLAAALIVKGGLDLFREVADALIAQPDSKEVVEIAVETCEGWARDSNMYVIKNIPESKTLDALRSGWLMGKGIQELCRANESDLDVLNDFYGYGLPWVLHAAAQQLRCVGDEDRAKAIDRLAILIELGLPNEAATLIYLSGIRSRSAATELSVYASTLLPGRTIRDMSRRLQDEVTADALRALVSGDTAEWLDLVRRTLSAGRERPVDVSPFTCEGSPSDQRIHVRSDGTKVYLVSSDLRWRRAVGSDESMPFETIANDPRYAFRYHPADGTWNAVLRDPRLSG